MEEIWKDIDCLKYYQVSNIGRIRSLNRFLTNDLGIIKNYKGQILKTSINRLGYCVVNITGNKKFFIVHRLVARAFIPNPENKPDINHKNCIKNDNRVENLEWATESENILHGIKNGKQVIIFGEECSFSKLTNSQVIEIKNKYKPRDKNFSGISFAKKFNVHPGTISKIIKEISWKQIKIK